MTNGLGEDTITRNVTDARTDVHSPTLVRNSYTLFFLRKSEYNQSSCFCLQGATPLLVHQVPRRWQSGIQHLTKMMNLKKLRRRLSLTFKGNRGIDTSLSDLAEQITIEDASGIKENGTG